jgi:uncharacterized Rmd1/YagE family protein
LAVDQTNFYWDRPELERLVDSMTNFLEAPKRTRDINQRLTYLSDIAELLRITLRSVCSVLFTRV